MHRIRWNRTRGSRWLVILLLLSVSGWLLADDDEDEEEHRHGERHEHAAGASRDPASIAPGASRALPPVVNTKWKEECSSCHMLYHPGLLPDRSWRAIMAGLDKHFGENASVDDPVRDEITAFLLANSADRGTSRRGAKIARSIPAGAAPLRITETAYFQRKHDELSPDVFKRPKVGSASNCVACHPGAENGAFSEDTARIPR
jgi:hypothetical protein